MTGITREQAACAVAGLFGTSALQTNASRTYDPWEVTDPHGKVWRFVYDSSIHAFSRNRRQLIPARDGRYKALNLPDRIRFCYVKTRYS